MPLSAHHHRFHPKNQGEIIGGLPSGTTEYSLYALGIFMLNFPDRKDILHELNIPRLDIW